MDSVGSTVSSGIRAKQCYSEKISESYLSYHPPVCHTMEFKKDESNNDKSSIGNFCKDSPTNILSTGLAIDCTGDQLGTDNIGFSLVYLPKYITKEVILAKLAHFGELEFFQYAPETDEKLGSTRGEKGLFHRAEFAFKDRENMFTFMSIKRLRVKGLQLKVIQTSFGLKNDKFNIEEEMGSNLQELDHSLKPTNKQYFNTRRINS